MLQNVRRDERTNFVNDGSIVCIFEKVDEIEENCANYPNQSFERFSIKKSEILST
jgi:hypothetical protein